MLLYRTTCISRQLTEEPTDTVRSSAFIDCDCGRRPAGTDPGLGIIVGITKHVTVEGDSTTMDVLETPSFWKKINISLKWSNRETEKNINMILTFSPGSVLAISSVPEVLTHGHRHGSPYQVGGRRSKGLGLFSSPRQFYGCIFRIVINLFINSAETLTWLAIMTRKDWGAPLASSSITCRYFCP